MNDSWQSLRRSEDSYSPKALRAWSERIRGEITKAIKVLPHTLESTARPSPSALASWFGFDAMEHGFAQRCPAWLSISETQAMLGLWHFSTSLGPEASATLFEALSPNFCSEPVLNYSSWVEEGVPRTGKRIDLIAKATTKNRNYLIVVEAKLGSSLAGNPLAEYRRHALQRLAEQGDVVDFVVLDYGQKTKTAARLKRNKDWRLLSWFVFLSRLERELAARLTDSVEYGQMRSMIWCRI